MRHPVTEILTAPPLCVYFCWVFAINLAMYSIEGASSQVKRKLWVSMRAYRYTQYQYDGKIHNFKLGMLMWSLQVALRYAKTDNDTPLTFSIKTLASAVKPANAIVKCSSNLAIFRMVRDSCRDAVAFLSTPRMTQSAPRTPTTADPLLTASIAYSTWKRCPSGEKTVIALS